MSVPRPLSSSGVARLSMITSDECGDCSASAVGDGPAQRVADDRGVVDTEPAQRLGDQVRLVGIE